MKKINIKNSKFDLVKRRQIVAALLGSQVLVLPTDTIYGLSCLVTSKKAVKRIFTIKQREENKPLITLVSSLSMAKRYAQIGVREERILKQLWQKDKRPTTVILSAKHKLAPGVISVNGGLSMRLPKSDFLIKIIRAARTPIVSTSLNLSGQGTIDRLSDLEKVFALNKQPDLVIDIGCLRRKRPSRLIDLRCQEIKIIRK